jgi:hypothetical protein
MKIWWVLSSDTYYPDYPGLDNFDESFETKEEAEEYVLSQGDRRDWYQIKNISNRLYEETGS